MHFDTQASSRRLEAAFPLHTVEGIKDFLEKLYKMEELQYFAGDYDISIWLVDFYEALRNCDLSNREMETVYFLYFEGYKQVELATKWGIKKNSLNTLLKRAIKKLAAHYEDIRLKEAGEKVA